MIIENFDDFYDHYQGFSAYVAFCITEDYELSKDISQEVFLALFKVKEKLDYSRPDKLKTCASHSRYFSDELDALSF